LTTQTMSIVRSNSSCVRALVCAALLTSAARAAGQSSPAEPFEITDNSFLVEEAFNQEPGVFQTITTWTRIEDSWVAAFTQEWPIFSMKHQLSYTIPFGSVGGDDTHLGAIFLNYRLQLLEESSGRPAFSPRFSVLLPTGQALEDRVGVQINLPFSKQHGDFYFHWNAGVTWLPDVPTDVNRVNLTSPQVAGSVIWRASPMFNLMLETVVLWADLPDDDGHTSHVRALTVGPGFRRGWNIGERQIVVGVASPIARVESDTSIGVLTYFSYEGPF